MQDRVPIRNEKYIWREIDGETFVLSEAGNKIITLNRVGSFIWEKCDGTLSLEQIQDGILEKFEVNKNVAKQDLDRFVSEMREHEMILFGS